MALTCAKCASVIPTYVGNIAGGFVQPTPARERKSEPHSAESAFVKFTQGGGGMTATALIDDSPVCADCYLELFAAANPGAELPVMPKVAAT